ncbi:MAG: type II methionyl aminopeptidase [Candidatus Methanofastidiosia archaeon]
MDERECYLKAGDIIRRLKEESRELIKDGGKYLDVAEFIERKIIEYGAKPAFPVNISVNNISAHYTPTIDDIRCFSKGDYVKIDLGAHVEGYIADSAFTVKVEENDDDLIKASQEALDAAIEMVRPGVKTNEIGKAIEDVIRSHDFKPIENLTGHGLVQYGQHAPPSIPNFDTGSGIALKEGDVIAIEPFVTDGRGKVVDDDMYLIFKYVTDRPMRLSLARKMFAIIKKNYSTLPFAQRWLSKMFTRRKTEFALKYLVRSSSIYGFSVLKEIDGGNVSQSEHSLFVTSDGGEVFT